jgi:phosphoserine phosphatase
MGLYEALGEFLKMPDKGTDVTAHQIDAAFAALTAKLHLDGNTKQIGYKREGIIVVPRPRRLQLVIFDMDGTLTKVKSPWQFLHEELGVWESGGLQWLKDYKKKIIDYQKFVKLDSDLWIGRHKEEIEGRLSKIELQRGVKKVISGLDNMGIKTAILSTGFTFLGDRIRRITGVDIKTYANELIYDRWGLFKGVKMRVSQDPGRMSKRSLVRRICHDAKVSQVNTMAVGDSETDNEMFESVGLAVGFNLNVELDSVDVEIQDLEDILSLCQ